VSSYFTKDTENAIVAFQKAPSLPEKEKIFNENIRPAFQKLIENTIFVYKFHTMGDVDLLKNDCLSFLFETLYKFDIEKR
jgi:hypothetical protein